MDWKEVIRGWRALPDWEQKAQDMQPNAMQTAQSMAFEGEPVSAEWLAEEQRKCDVLAVAIRRQGMEQDRQRANAHPPTDIACSEVNTN